jgi:uncharacterized damage-inducible protein DinB
MSNYDVAPTEGLHPELGLLFATLEDGAREWQGELETVSDEAVVWQPFPNGPSIGGIILHMASCSLYWLSEFALGEAVDKNRPEVAYDLSMDQYAPAWPAPPAKPMSWYLELLAENRQETRALLARHGDPTRSHVRKEETMTFRWIVGHLVQHDCYHGGQIVLLNEMWKQLHGQRPE